jgi:protein required for attachment to host cells
VEQIRIPKKSWVMVCDGAKALIFRNDGDAELLNLVPTEIGFKSQLSEPASHADRRGRVYQSQGAARSAIEEADWHLQAEETFLKDIAQQLDASVRNLLMDKLVLIAPPKALGILRRHLAPATRAVVIGEVAKDLVKFPIPEIEKYLSYSTRG